MGILSRLFRPGPTVDRLPFAETRLAHPVPADRYASVAYSLPAFQQGKAVWPTWDLYAAEECYRKTAIIVRCLSLVAHAVGTAPLRVYDEQLDDDEVPDHPLRMLVRQPNPNQGEALFWGTVALRAALAGFCVVEKERDGLGVIALNPLRSAWLKAVPRGRGQYDWEYRVPGQSTVNRLKAEDVVAFRWFDTPDGSPYGMSALGPVVRDVGILDKLTEFLGNLLDRGGVPMWMLLRDDNAVAMEQAEVDAWTAAFLQRRGGFDRRGVPWLAEGIKDARQLSYDPNELAMVAVRDLSDLAICQAFGVPPHKAGARVGLEHTTQNATAQVEDGAFYRDTIVPLWTRFDDAMTTALLPDFEAIPTTRYLGFDTSDVAALQENRNDRAPWLLQGFASGAFSQHTIYRELGIPLPTTEDFYLRSIASEVVPVEDPRQETPPSTTTTPPPVASPQNGQDGNNALSRLVPITNGHTPRNGHYSASERYVKRAAIGAANKTLMGNVARATEPTVRNYFRDQGERVAAAVESALAAPGPSDGYAVAGFDWAAELPIVGRLLRRLHLVGVQEAYGAASDHVGVDVPFDPDAPATVALFDRLATAGAGIVNETRTRVDALLANARSAEVTPVEAAADVRALFGEMGQGRAGVVARTEAMRSVNTGLVAAYEASGVVDRVQMFDSSVHCEDYGAVDGLTCCDRNGLIVGLAETHLHIAGEHPNGSLNFAPVATGEGV